MKWNKVQLMVYGDNLNDVTVSTTHNGINIEKTYITNNRKYLFVDITVPDELISGEYELIFKKDSESVKYAYPILERKIAPEDHNGFSNEDVIYLIFADRFCDGNLDNNTIGDSLDEFTSADLDGRKGGDIEAGESSPLSEAPFF